MKCARLFAVVVGFAVLANLGPDAFARYRMYNPATGAFMQRDPLGTPDGPPMARNLSPSEFTRRDPTEQYADGMSLYQYVSSAPTVRVDPYGLWGANIHKTATTFWAREARGYDEERQCTTMFSGQQADYIGGVDEGVDHGETAPGNDTSWHFRSRGSLAHEQQAVTAALEDAKNGKCATAITHLGISLHPLQDSFSHTESHGAATPADHVKTSIKAKLPFSKTRDPDDAAAWPEDVAAAEEATKERLKEFLSLPCNLCVQCENTE